MSVTLEGAHILCGATILRVLSFHYASMASTLVFHVDARGIGECFFQSGG